VTQLDMLTTLVDYVREQGAMERLELKRAVRVAERKIEVLRIKRVAHAHRSACPRCGANCSGILCYRCWSAIPYELRRMWDGAKTEQGKREAARAVFEYVKRERIAA
jgi:tRNA(Ile2) C34 agmatinyltransferase TiaS